MAQVEKQGMVGGEQGSVALVRTSILGRGTIAGLSLVASVTCCRPLPAMCSAPSGDLLCSISTASIIGL